MPQKQPTLMTSCLWTCSLWAVGDNQSVVWAIQLLVLCHGDPSKLTYLQRAFLFYLFILTGGNCFTILCWFVPYINVKQPQVYYVTSLLSLPPTSHPIPPSRLSRSSGFSLQCHIANAHWLSILHIIMHIFQCYSSSSSHSLLPRPPSPGSTSLLSMSASLFLNDIYFHQYQFSRFHIYAFILDACFSPSDLLHSL